MSTRANARIRYKHDTIENWENSSIIPLKGELLIHDNSSATYLKVGDNIKTATNLPYVLFDVSGESDPELIPISKPTLETSAFTYDGNYKYPIIGYNDSTMNKEGTDSAINAGVYAVRYTPKEGYCWEDTNTTERITFSWKINQATPTLELTDSSITLTQQDLEQEVRYTVNEELKQKVTATSQNSSIVTATIDKDNNTIKLVAGDEKGSTTVYVSIEETNNYTEVSKTIYVTNDAGISITLNDNSWETISKVSKEGRASDKWSVGDIKEITLTVYVAGEFIADSTGEGRTPIEDKSGYTGYIVNPLTGIVLIDYKTIPQAEVTGTSFYSVSQDGSLARTSFKLPQGETELFSTSTEIMKVTKSDIKLYVYIIGFENNRVKFGTFLSGETPVCFYPHAMNTNNNDNVSWKDSELRNILNESLKNSLPEELRNVLQPMTVSTYSYETGNLEDTIDEITLMSEKEVIGTCVNSNNAEINHKQYKYYENANSRFKYDYLNTLNKVSWWLRSPATNDSFCIIDKNGNSSSLSQTESAGISAIFTV